MSNAQKLSQAVAGGTSQWLDSADIGVTVGYPNVPATSFTSGTLTTAERGKYSPITGATTIPDNVFAAGDVVSLYNNSASTITITCTITTAYIAGTDSDKATMTLAARGLATILFLSGTVCVVQGNVS
jgi:thioredoxin reductase